MRLTSPLETLWEVCGEPVAEKIGIYEMPDRSYGRWQTPFSSMEKRLYANPDIDVTFHKVLLANGKDYVWYQIWQDLLAIRTTGRNADMIFVHGTGVHSGTLASQCRRYLDAGFRLLVPDLPSHGYSSGLHVYQSNLRGYCSGLHAVLHDVARRDQIESPFPSFRPKKIERKQTFMLGLSFGGLVAFSYALHYPGSHRDEKLVLDEIPIDGIIGVGPMVDYDRKHVYLNPIVKWIFYFMILVLNLGRLEVMVPHKKVVDKDPKVYESLIMQDPRSHQGSFRLGHMYCIEKGMAELQSRAHEIHHPIYIQSGGQDRVADNDAALEWMRNIPSEDKRFEIYPVCQHVIYKKGESEHDDLAGRITVIADNVDWMCQRSPGTCIRNQVQRSVSYTSDVSTTSKGSFGASLFEEDSANSDSDSTCTTICGTPTLQSEEAIFMAATLVNTSTVSKGLFAASTSPPGWKLDDKGERRLYRLLWEYGEDTRPFLLCPHRI